MLKVKWPQILSKETHTPFIEWVDLGNGTMFRVIAFFSVNCNSHPRNGLFVAIERIGSYFFRIDNINKIQWEYVSEKLNIPEPDARIMADWMNAQIGFDVSQQGYYDIRYVKGDRTYKLAGEQLRDIIRPVII